MVLFRTQINADREDKKFKYKELTAKRCISFIGFITNDDISPKSITGW
ncbi:hypothetical protein LR066_03970 [candidate division WOR-3 bacterium]|nr:hypothetical protein [candidate division WOR-3 bacterium]